MTLALRFISGKYQGGEFPLEEGHEVVIGRSSELDMVLVEEMVSRRHARLCLRGSAVEIEDLGSTNGTFVNGERIRQATVGEGDRILIGSNILRVVALGGSLTPMEPGPSASAVPEPAQQMRRGVRRPEGDVSQEVRMTGELDEIPLPDLLQLFGTSKKDGVLLVDSGVSVGSIWLKQGIVYHATIRTAVPASEPIDPRRAVYRMLAWESGVFELDPPGDMAVDEPLNASVQELLMDGFRLRDEMAHILGRLPALDAPLQIPRPVSARLSGLTPVQLDLLQEAINQGTVGGALDASPHDDASSAEALVELIAIGALRVASDAD